MINFSSKTPNCQLFNPSSFPSGGKGMGAGGDAKGVINSQGEALASAFFAEFQNIARLQRHNNVARLGIENAVFIDR
jgi:hypothetical protein